METTWEYQNIKTFLQTAMFQIGQSKFLGLKTVRKFLRWMYVITDLTGDKTVGVFYKKELQKQIKNKLKFKK